MVSSMFMFSLADPWDDPPSGYALLINVFQDVVPAGGATAIL